MVVFVFATLVLSNCVEGRFYFVPGYVQVDVSRFLGLTRFLILKGTDSVRTIPLVLYRKSINQPPPNKSLKIIFLPYTAENATLAETTVIIFFFLLYCIAVTDSFIHYIINLSIQFRHYINLVLLYPSETKMTVQPPPSALKSNNTSNNNKKPKNNKQNNTKKQIRNENSKPFQNNQNPKKNQERSNSPRKKKAGSTVLAVKGLRKDNISLDEVVTAQKHSSTVLNPAVNGRSSLVSTTATIRDKSGPKTNCKDTPNALNVDSTKFTNSQPANTADKRVVIDTGNPNANAHANGSSNPTTASYHLKKGKYLHYRKKKSIKKGSGVNNQKDNSAVASTMVNSSNDLNRQTAQNQQIEQHQQQREHSIEKERIWNTINDVSKEGHNQDEKKQSDNKENIKGTKQEHQRNLKNYKGHNRKWHYSHQPQRKPSNNNLVQQRDVNNYKPPLEEGRRTAISPLNVNAVNAYPTTDMNPIVSPEDSSIKEKTDTSIDLSSPKNDYDVGKHSNRNNKTHKKQHQWPKSSGGNSTPSKVIESTPNLEVNITTKERREDTLTYCNGDSKATISKVTLDDFNDREEHLQKSKLENDEKRCDNDPRPTSPSSTGNVVTTNAAGKALLKRLSVSNVPPSEVVSPPGGYTVSTTGATNDIDLDCDANTILSGDMSHIDLNIEQGQEFDANMMYANPVIFQPQHHLQVPPFEAMGTAYKYEVPIPHQHQQWIMSAQSEIPSQQDYSNMIAFNAQNQQPPIAMNPMLNHLRHENNMYQPVPVVVPPFYEQGYQMFPQVPMSNIQQQQQLQPTPTAPVPMKYEQFTIGGCVFFNPVYNFPGGNGSVSACSLNTIPAEKEAPTPKEKTVAVTKVDSDKGKKKQDDQKRKGKSGRKKKKYQKKKTTIKGN